MAPTAPAAEAARTPAAGTEPEQEAAATRAIGRQPIPDVSEVVATKVVAPTQGQRALAIVLVQRVENKKPAGLIRSPHVPREVRFGR